MRFPVAAIIDLPCPSTGSRCGSACAWLSCPRRIALAAGCGSPTSWPIANFRGKEVLDAAVTLPLVLPPTVLGYYLLVLIGRASPYRETLGSDVRLAAGVHLESRGGGGAAALFAAAGEIGAGGA